MLKVEEIDDRLCPIEELRTWHTTVMLVSMKDSAPLVEEHCHTKSIIQTLLAEQRH